MLAPSSVSYALTGIVRWLITRARTYYGPSGGRPASAVLSLDITDRKSMEEKIQPSAEEWQRTFDSVSDQIMILDKDLRIIRINASAVLSWVSPWKISWVSTAFL